MRRLAIVALVASGMTAVVLLPKDRATEVAPGGCELRLNEAQRNAVGTAMSDALDAYGAVFIKLPAAAGEPYTVSVGPAPDADATQLHAVAVSAGSADGAVTFDHLSPCVGLTITEAEPVVRGAPLPP